ncbi:MAG: diacylglycerol kinase family protein [Chitinophagaceae bacterium]
MVPHKFSWRGRLKSFVYAYEGLKWFFRREHNAWIHGFSTLFVLLISLVLKISKLEFIAVLMAIALVLVAEMINTAIEKIMDHLSPAHDPAVKAIKDIAAAVVLVAAIIAAIIGLLIFIPKIL